MSRVVPQWVKDAKPNFCAVCGKTNDLQYHHWIPVAIGGETVPENIIVLCAKHHQELHEQKGQIKHNYLISEGIAKRKQKGGNVGKRPADYENVMRLIAERSTQFNDYPDTLYTESEIMAVAGVRPVCYSKCKRMLIEAMKADTWPYEWNKPRIAKNRPMYERQIKRIRGNEE